MPAEPLARYAAWKRKGDFLFLSGMVAVDTEARQIIRGFDDLPSEVGPLIGQTGEFSTDAKDGPILAQSWFILDQIQSTIQEAGGAMADVFKLVQYFSNLSDFPRYKSVRDMFFPEDPPVSTVVEVSGMMPSKDIILEIEATAYLPQASD